MNVSIEDISAKVGVLCNRNPVYAEILQWLGELLSETVRFEQTHVFGLERDMGKIGARPVQGRPASDPGEWALDWPRAWELYERLVECLRRRRPEDKDIDKLLKAFPGEGRHVPGLLLNFMMSDYRALHDFSVERGVEPPVLILLIQLSLRPMLMQFAEKVRGQLDLSHWESGRCPVCGSFPKLTDLSGEGGKRRLHCSLCESTWSYPRIKCPFCENEDAEQLGYLQAEEDIGLRVELCRLCGHYIKSLDLRELAGPVILPLDDAATYHLDLMATRFFEKNG